MGGFRSQAPRLAAVGVWLVGGLVLSACIGPADNTAEPTPAEAGPGRAATVSDASGDTAGRSTSTAVTGVPEPAGREVPLEAPALPGAPTAVTERMPLPFCGITLHLRPTANEFEGLVHDTTAEDCFAQRLRAGQEAELILVSSTVEGSETVSVHRHLGDGEGELWLDATRDPGNGSGRWDYYTCTGFTGFTGPWPDDCQATE